MLSKKYIIPLLTVLLLVGFVFIFTNVFIYLVISLVLALLGMPIVVFITKLRIGKFHISDGIAAIITICIFFTLIYIIGITFLPPLISQISFLSKSNLHDVLENIFKYYPSLKEYMLKLGSDKQIANSISEQFNEFANFKNVSSVFNNTISFTGSILGGLFSVLFITFFFLKDEKLVVKSLLLITPSEFEGEMIDIFRTSKKMLSSYFVGLFIDVILISIIVTSLMWIFGIKNALVIGCLAGIMNIIPYIGPIITLLFAIFLGVSGCIEYNQYELISSTITKIVIILIGTNLVDAMLIQPTIFSNTVKAHPLEIFIVILMAGAIGGIIGMVVAIPTYTLLRIIAKEFFSHLKFFKKLTQNIPE
jgi:predicted PurR-regulated permease PerM